MPLPEDWDRQSMLYLLGELDAEQTRHVEEQLEAFPRLGEDLLRQADVIAALTAPANQVALSGSGEHHRGAHHRGTRRWPLVASLVAMAACLAMVVLGVKPRAVDQDATADRAGSPANISESGNAEELLIARAWASHQHELADDIGLVEAEIDDAAVITAADDSHANESTLAWMFIAVSAGSEALAPGVTNDG